MSIKLRKIAIFLVCAFAIQVLAISLSAFPVPLPNQASEAPERISVSPNVTNRRVTANVNGLAPNSSIGITTYYNNTLDYIGQVTVNSDGAESFEYQSGAAEWATGGEIVVIISEGGSVGLIKRTYFLQPTVITTPAGALAGGAVNASYSQQLIATGEGNITWSVVNGSLPTGLSLSTSGLISGTPMATGTSTFTLRAAGTIGVNPEREFSITIGRAVGAVVDAPTMSTRGLTSITVGSPAPLNEQAVEYAKAYTNVAPADGWQESGMFDELTADTEYFFFARAKENALFDAGTFSAGTSVRTVANVNITTNWTLPLGTVGEPYEVQLETSGGVAPLAWHLTFDNWEDSDNWRLPEGLSFDTTTGKITGTPTESRIGETFNFYANVVCSEGSVNQRTFYLTVNRLTGAVVAAPQLVTQENNPGETQVIVNSAAPGNGQLVEYAVNTENSAPTEPTDWQESGTFSGLTENTEYYFFARAKENVTHITGAASSGTKISTLEHECSDCLCPTCDCNCINVACHDCGICVDCFVPCNPTTCGVCAGFGHCGKPCTTVCGNADAQCCWQNCAAGSACKGFNLCVPGTEHGQCGHVCTNTCSHHACYNECVVTTCGDNCAYCGIFICGDIANCNMCQCQEDHSTVKCNNPCECGYKGTCGNNICGTTCCYVEFTCNDCLSCIPCKDGCINTTCGTTCCYVEFKCNDCLSCNPCKDGCINTTCGTTCCYVEFKCNDCLSCNPCKDGCINATCGTTCCAVEYKCGICETCDPPYECTNLCPGLCGNCLDCGECNCPIPCPCGEENCFIVEVGSGNIAGATAKINIEPGTTATAKCGKPVIITNPGDLTITVKAIELDESNTIEGFFNALKKFFTT